MSEILFSSERSTFQELLKVQIRCRAAASLLHSESVQERGDTPFQWADFCQFHTQQFTTEESQFLPVYLVNPYSRSVFSLLIEYSWPPQESHVLLSIKSDRVWCRELFCTQVVPKITSRCSIRESIPVTFMRTPVNCAPVECSKSQMFIAVHVLSGRQIRRQLPGAAEFSDPLRSRWRLPKSAADPEFESSGSTDSFRHIWNWNLWADYFSGMKQVSVLIE